MIMPATPIRRIGAALGGSAWRVDAGVGISARPRRVLEALESRQLLALAAQFATVASGSPVIPSQHFRLPAWPVPRSLRPSTRREIPTSRALTRTR